jgi:protein farnesyltransferase subunit beta
MTDYIIGLSCNIEAQENWLLKRQMKLEGGFQGRTNKLVDSCYSFWQGAAIAIVHIIKAGGDDLTDMKLYMHRKIQKDTTDVSIHQECDDALSLNDVDRVSVVTDSNGALRFNQKALQKYILHCGQQTDNGGLRDKPGKSRDYYHSCYALSGLSIAQWSNIPSQEANSNDFKFPSPKVYGDFDNLVKPTSVVFNIGLEKLSAAIDYFSVLPPIR